MIPNQHDPTYNYNTQTFPVQYQPSVAPNYPMQAQMSTIPHNMLGTFISPPTMLNSLSTSNIQLENIRLSRAATELRIKSITQRTRSIILGGQIEKSHHT